MLCFQATSMHSSASSRHIIQAVVCWCWAGMKCSVLCDVSTLLLQAMLQVASYTSVMHCLVRQFIVDCCCFCITRSHPLVYAQTSTTATTQYNVCLLTWLVVWRVGVQGGGVGGGVRSRYGMSPSCCCVAHTHNCCIFGAACRGLEIYVFVSYMYM